MCSWRIVASGRPESTSANTESESIPHPRRTADSADVAQVAVARVSEFEESVVQFDERVRLVVAHGNSDLQCEESRIGFRCFPDVGHARLDMRLSETERNESDVPVRSSSQSVNDVIVGDASVGASIVPGNGKGSCHLCIPHSRHSVTVVRFISVPSEEVG